MRECCVCHTFLVKGNEGIDHIGFEPNMLKQIVFICQGCLGSIQDQVEYGVSYKYAEV